MGKSGEAERPPSFRARGRRCGKRAAGFAGKGRWLESTAPEEESLPALLPRVPPFRRPGRDADPAEYAADILGLWDL